jgi:hypothetical protein
MQQYAKIQSFYTFIKRHNIKCTLNRKSTQLSGHLDKISGRKKTIV